MSGRNLLTKLGQLTGLPEQAIEAEFLSLVKAQGINPDTITLEQIRTVLALYLQETLVSAKQELDKNFCD